MQFCGRLVPRLINAERIFTAKFGGVLSGRLQPFHTVPSTLRQKAANAVPSVEAAGPIRAAYQASPASRNLVVELAGQRREFPLVWLRDNCQCPECFHAVSYSRVHDWERFDPDGIIAQKCSVTDDGNRVDITWHDGHRSSFDVAWLEERNFSEENSRRYLEEWYRPRHRLWKKHEFGEVLKSFEFRDVIERDEALQAWIEALIRYGVVMIRNAPITEQECRKMANRVGFIRKTHYG